MPTVTNYDVLGGVPWGADRSDARAGINMLLFDNGAHGAANLVPQEHAYAAAMVSANAYYGYHPQHQDCSMDTSENGLPPPGELHPALHQSSRKRRPATGLGLGNDLDDVLVKRTRCCPDELENESLDVQPGASTSAQTQALPQGFAVQSSNPSIATAQMYDLPIHQLPGSTSQLTDAMTPRPRCLMGHFI